MVWGGKTAHGRTPLVVVAGNLTGMRYRDEIVQPYVIPFHPSSGQQRHLSAGQRSTTCCTSSA
jgi:hypothetical protein